MLAGGRSRRMGRDKAALMLDGCTLLEHALDRLRAAGFEPVRAGSTPATPGETGAFVADSFADSGPVAGLHASLTSLGHRQEQALFTPVDLPLLPVEFLRWLWDRARSAGAAATIPTVGGRPQPLCAVYATALAPGLQALLAAGERTVMRAVAQTAGAASLDLFAVEAVAPLAGWSGVEHWFTNLNTPDDWAAMTAARSLTGSRCI